MQVGRRVIRKQRERGNVLIEFALMSTVLLMMTLGVADFGRIFTVANKASNAAAAGTAYGALSPAHYTDMAGMQTAAQNDLGNLATGATVTAVRSCRCSIGGAVVDCTSTCSAGQSRETYIQVTVVVPYHGYSGLQEIPGLVNVSGQSTVRVE